MTKPPLVRTVAAAARGALRPALAPIVVVAIAAAAAGCFNPFSPRIAPERGIVEPPPIPSSAPGVLRLFEWCYNNKAIAEYRELFTDDYRFVFSPLDSAGAEYRGVPFTREDELISATQLFVGGSAESPASSITLNLDKNFFVRPDPRYTWDPLGRWHKNIRTQVVLNIRTSDGNAIDISGAANFYFVRGDSALIPDELEQRGFGPDSTRWYIQRWDDETVQPDGAPAQPPGGPGLALRPAGAAPVRPVGREQTLGVNSWGEFKVGLISMAGARR